MAFFGSLDFGSFGFDQGHGEPVYQEPVPSTVPEPLDLGQILTQGAQAIGAGVDAIERIRSAQDDREFRRFETGLRGDLARTQLSGAVRIEQLRTEAEVARAGRNLNEARGLSMFTGSGQTARRDWVGLVGVALAGAGLWYAMQQRKAR